MFDKPGTYVEEAERFVASCVMQRTDEADAARAVLKAEDFYNTGCRLVFMAASELRDVGEEVNAPGVQIRLSQTGRLADLGPLPSMFLADLMGVAPTAASLPYAMQLVKDSSVRRGIARVAAEMMQATTDPSDTAEDIAARFERQLSDVAAGTLQSKGPVLLADAMRAAIDRYKSPAARTLVPTGLPTLDNMLGGGFGAGQLCILAARPSVGKSALALQFAEAAARSGAGVLVASLEMTEEENTDRLVSTHAGVSLPRLRGSGQIEPHQMDRIAELLNPGSIADLPIWIDDRPGRTATAVVATAKRSVRKNGVKVVVVDYLQLLRPENPREPRYLQVGTSAKYLKELAKDAGVAVVCLAQLNREVEARDGGRPMLSDLRDSGEIEQDADVVMLLHRTSSGELEAAHSVDLIVAKQRNGPIGTVDLDFHRTTTRFEERYTPQLPSDVLRSIFLASPGKWFGVSDLQEAFNDQNGNGTLIDRDTVLSGLRSLGQCGVIERRDTDAPLEANEYRLVQRHPAGTGTGP